jgi:hypothetical protein
MDTSIAKEVIRVIREERDKRLAALETEDEDLWYRGHSDDELFINELCLMLLVAIRHEIERELTLFVAQKTSKESPPPPRGPGDPVDPVGRKLTDGEYMGLVKKVKNLTKKKNAWKEEIYPQLGLDADTEHWLETLRHLSNSYKHDQHELGNYRAAFLEHLKLGPERNPMALAESPAIREALAKDLELTSEANYCDIGEAFLNRVSDLLAKLEKEFGVRGFLVSSDPVEFGA